MTARFIIGDSLTVVRSLPDASAHMVLTSPPYLRQREYLPTDHPDKALEVGREPTPGEFLEALLCLMDELWRVLTPDGTFWVNLGDKHAGSGGAGGDYNAGGAKEGQPKFGAVRPGPGWPLDQSVCWTPHLFGASLAYGRNLLTGVEHQKWVTRPAVTWCKPGVQPGRDGRKFRTATELVIYGGKHQEHYFDLDGVRYDPPPENERTTWNQQGPKQRLQGGKSSQATGMARYTKRTFNENGAPPLNYWIIPTQSYEGAHFATFPPDLCVIPVIAGCPAGGTILDPFGGTGVSAMVATGHGRNAILIDLDERNADLARERVGMWLTVEGGDRAA